MTDLSPPLRASWRVGGIVRRQLAMLGLGAASGLPFLLTNDALQTWLRESKVDITSIGLFGLVAMPYTLKFAWAPLLDRYIPPLLGRRRGWLMIFQLLVAAAAVSMAWQSPARSLTGVAVLAIAIALFSASQDIVGDAYRSDLLPDRERGIGAAIWVNGYRLAMIASGFLGYWLVGQGYVGWGGVYAGIGFLLAGSVLVTLMAPEPAEVAPPPPSLLEAFVGPIVQFGSRTGAAWILGFIVLFTLPDVLAKSLGMAFLSDVGFTNTDVAYIRQGLGIAMTMAGALAGGGLVAWLGLRRALWVMGILQAASNLGFVWLATAGADRRVFAVVTGVENFCGGLVAAGFVAFLMSQCDVRYSAAQYAALSSLMRVTGVLAGAVSGYAQARVGWQGYYLATVVAALPGMMLIPLLPAPRLATKERMSDAPGGIPIQGSAR